MYSVLRTLGLTHILSTSLLCLVTELSSVLSFIFASTMQRSTHYHLVSDGPLKLGLIQGCGTSKHRIRTSSCLIIKAGSFHSLLP